MDREDQGCPARVVAADSMEETACLAFHVVARKGRQAVEQATLYVVGQSQAPCRIEFPPPRPWFMFPPSYSICRHSCHRRTRLRPRDYKISDERRRGSSRMIQNPRAFQRLTRISTPSPPYAKRLTYRCKCRMSLWPRCCPYLLECATVSVRIPQATPWLSKREGGALHLVTSH